MAEWQKDEIVLVINQDARRALTRAKILQKNAKRLHLKVIICAGIDLDYTLRRELTDNKKLKRLIIAGGDGSISIAVSLVLRLNKKVEIGVIPVGTSNYYAKNLGIKNIAGAFKIATGTKTEQRHVCEANGRIFMMIADVGVTSKMLEQVTDAEKKRFGKLAYIWGVFRLFISFDPMRVTIQANGEKKSYVTTEVLVINQSIDERVHLQPKVHSSQPFFEIVTYGTSNSKLSPLFAVAIFILTLGKNQKYLKRIQATEAFIETDRPEVVSLDGDTQGKTPLKVKMVKKKIVFAVA